MSITSAPPDVPPAPGTVSIARLHGEACYICGAVNADLQPAGAVSTVVDGGIRIWQIVACPECCEARP